MKKRRGGSKDRMPELRSSEELPPYGNEFVIAPLHEFAEPNELDTEET